jgi:hypothetical protein
MRMKYLLLIHIEEAALDAMAPHDMQALINESLDYDDVLRRGGHLLANNALQRVHTATIVRVRNNKLSTTDGPFVETKEQLGGFILIEARDLNEAIQLAANSPMARAGSVEVRPIMELQRAPAAASAPERA